MWCTLEPGYFGTEHLVHCRELVLSLEAKMHRLVHQKVPFIQRCPLFRVSFIRGSTVYPCSHNPSSVYKVMDMAPLDRVIVELVEPHTLEHNTSLTGENSLAAARWAVSKAGENYAFLVTLPDVRRSYTFVATRCAV